MKKIIILGGGFAGSFLAKKLENRFQVTLIDTKDYFEFTPGILRTIVEPEHYSKVQIEHKKYLKKTKLIRKKVSSISKDHLKINNKIINFDYLIICSGSSYNNPIKDQTAIMASRAEILRKYHNKLNSSKRVLVIGGGLAGVEMAAEICTHYKKKEVFLIHPGETLITRNNKKTISHVHHFFSKNNVELILKERVIKSEKGYFVTDKKTRLKADMAILCTGIKPNSHFIRKDFPHLVDKKGFVKVDEYLRLEGSKNIFALGDVNNLNIEKTAQNAEKQAELTLKNIKRIEKNKDLRKYHPKKTSLVISLGKYQGIYEYKNFVWKGLIPAIMKYMIEKIEMFKRHSF